MCGLGVGVGGGGGARGIVGKEKGYNDRFDSQLTSETKEKDVNMMLYVCLVQVEDYAARKQMEVAAVERWCSSILAYDH